jgi:hypothetical protein
MLDQEDLMVPRDQLVAEVSQEPLVNQDLLVHLDPQDQLAKLVKEEIRDNKEIQEM